MFENGYVEEYFCWLVDRALGERKESYHRLMLLLFQTDFIFTIPNDENRFKDGIALRYQFGWDNRYSTKVVEDNIDIYPCSVLEMMVSLCRRMESEYMYNPREGDRTSDWFCSMLDTMFISDYTDDKWNSGNNDSIIRRLNTMMYREYLPSGEGGLFICYKNNVDMRRLSYWDQMLKKVNELFGY